MYGRSRGIGPRHLVAPGGLGAVQRLVCFLEQVKLTNAKDLVKRGLVAEGDDPLKVAAERLVAGSSTPNSSPPIRATRSPARPSCACKAWATVTRHWSPMGCP